MLELWNLRLRIWKLKALLALRNARERWSLLQSQTRLLAITLRPHVILFQGDATATKERLSILWAGQLDLFSRTFGKYCFTSEVVETIDRETDLGRHWLWTLRKLAKHHSASFVLSVSPFPLATLTNFFLGRTRHRTFLLPLLVESIVDISDEKKLLQEWSLKQDVRNVINRGFSYTVSQDPDDFVEFVERFYKPSATGRHGFDAIIVSYETFLFDRDRWPPGFHFCLIKVTLDSQWVSAILIRLGRESAELFDLGIRDANPSYMKLGALSAAFWFSTKYIREQGYKEANFRYARPFLANGSFRFKLKYRPKLRVPQHFGGILLSTEKESELVEHILVATPFLYLEKGALKAACFIGSDADAPAEGAKFVKRYGLEGVSDISLIPVRDFLGTGKA